MKKFLTFLLTIVSIFSFAFAEGKKSERKIAVQTYTFVDSPLDELPEILKEVGVDTIGASGGLFLSKKYPNVRFNAGMNAEQREYAKKILADNNIKLASYGVVGSKTKGDVENLCKFAKEFNCPVIITEDKPEQFPFWDEIGPKYGVKMAVHNHAKDQPNGYYNPEYVLSIIKDYKNIMAAADNGHWARSGVSSVAGYTLLKGRLAAIHFKDMNKFGELNARCVPFGTGKNDVPAALKYLDSIGYDGFFVIEYEGTKHPVKEVKECVEFLRKN